MADDPKKIAGLSDSEEEMPETSGIYTVTRGSVQNQLTKPEASVQFYDETSFPQELQLPEILKENELAVEVHRQAKRILCGNEPNISQKDFDYAKEFVEVLVAPSKLTKEGAAHIQMLESLVNTDLSHRIEEQIAFDQPSSILSQQRRMLGIHTEKDEKPFQVRVLEMEGKSHHERMSKWREITTAPGMFLYEHPSGEPVICLPSDSAKIILNPDAEDRLRMDTIKKLCHEYRHTQRSAALGSNKALFRSIDEPLANIIGYQYLTFFLNLFTKTTNTIKFAELYDAYESGDDKQMAGHFSQVADAIGAKGLLLLGGQKCSDCSSEEEGIEDLPLEEGDFYSNEWLQMAETILVLREEKDADWEAKFEKNLQNEQISLEQLEASFIILVSQFTKEGILNSDAHLVRELLGILQNEIVRRRELAKEAYRKSA